VGVDGSTFYVSSAADAWNMWFPEGGGCYWVDLNTSTAKWSALHLPTLTVSGDIAGEMTFDRATRRWTLPFTATGSSASIQVATTARLYDTTTGDAAYTDSAVAFGGTADALTFGASGGTISVAIAAEGESTLILDLSGEVAKISVEAGAVEPPAVVLPQLYLVGIDDGTGASWNFNTKVPLQSEETLSYVGVANVNSLWGYQIGTEDGNWSDVYKLGEGDASAGSLVMGAQNNIPAPAAGLYLFDISLSALTYKLTAVTEVAYYGLNDDWSHYPLTATSTPGVYSGSITITKVSEWGFQISLNQSWDLVYGGSEGKLYYKGSNIKDDATLGVGTYTLTVDLVNATYSITK
jgi:hypothetical protein